MVSLRLALILALFWNLIPFPQAWAALSYSRGAAGKPAYPGAGRAALAQAGPELPRRHGNAPVLTPGSGQAPTPGWPAAGAALPTLPLGEQSRSLGPAAKPASTIPPGLRLARGLESLAKGMEKRRVVSESPVAAPAALLDAAFDNAAGRAPRAPTDLGGGPHGGGGGLSPDSGSGQGSGFGRGSGGQDVPPPAAQGPAPRGPGAFKFEVSRKAFHQLTLLYLPAYHLIPYSVFLPLLAAWTALFGVGEYLRIRTAWGKKALSWLGLSGILREKEVDRPSGAFFVSMGVLLTAGLFGYEPVLVAAGILALSLGDAVSPLVGMRFGWRPYIVMGARRSLDGTLAGLLTAFLIALALGFSPLAALAAAAAFSVVDTIPLRPDDNLWIPVVFAAALFFSSLAPYILGLSLLVLGLALWRPIIGLGLGRARAGP